MAKQFFWRSGLRLIWLSRRQRSTTGFTLTELLVSMLIGSIITSSLLFGIIELLQTNQRESSRAETQREMQLALDYISADLREAVFVYDGTCLKGATETTGSCSGVTDYIPTAVTGTNKYPVLAFWRTKELPSALIDRCTAKADEIDDESISEVIRGVPCLSRRTLSLVVYYIEAEPNPTTWQGKARLRRYELSQFSSSQPGPNPSFVAGWVDPTTTDNQFLGWPNKTDAANKVQNLQSANTLPDGTTNYNKGTPTGDGDTLVDFVDEPIVPTIDSGKSDCPSSPTDNLPPLIRTPNATVKSSSFYACVRGGGVAANTGNRDSRNQEVAIFLRGNAAGRSGIPLTADLPFNMETRVLTRGSYNKNPAQ